MTAVAVDQNLVKEYVARNSDDAFRALVARHINLVYATAFRQLGDRGLAEEITQNVFLALARKAPRLAGVHTLAGWLHRTTILEAKTRIRSELRRRRREECAIALAEFSGAGDAPSEMLLLLDEGMLNLAEKDRLALVLRFLEDRSLREVGNALGVDEDAARKRVSRALERLTGFFRARGLAASIAVTGSTLAAASSQAAPLGLIATSTTAALAAGGTTNTFNLLLFHLMSLNKTQIAVACCLLAALPLALLHRAEARITTERNLLLSQVLAARQSLNALETDRARFSGSLLHLDAEITNAGQKLAELEAGLSGKLPHPKYAWNDNSPLVRIPKASLEKLSLNAVSNRRGHLTDQIKAVLQMNKDEEQAAQAALDRFVADFNVEQGRTLRRVSPETTDLGGHEPEETRVFAVPALGDQLTLIRTQLFSELEATLGPERFRLMQKALENWMPLDDEYRGMNSGMAVFNFDHRVIFYKPAPGREWLDWQIRKPNGEMMSFTVNREDIPAAFRPYVQDWVAIAESVPPSENNE